MPSIRKTSSRRAAGRPRSVTAPVFRGIAAPIAFCRACDFRGESGFGAESCPACRTPLLARCRCGSPMIDSALVSCYDCGDLWAYAGSAPGGAAAQRRGGR